MSKYNDFLETAVNIVSEDDFNEVMLILPDITTFDGMSLDDIPKDKEDLAFELISNLLYRWSYVYLEDLNYKNKTITLSDVSSVKELDEIKEFFPHWTISNYDWLKEDLLQSEREKNENKIYQEKIKIARELCNIMSLNELNSIYESYRRNQQSD